MGLKINFVLAVFASSLFFSEAICVSRKLQGIVIGHSTGGISPTIHRGGRHHVKTPNAAGNRVARAASFGGSPLNSICSKTDYANLCISSISPILHGLFDPVHILTAEIEATTVTVKNAITQVQTQLRNPRNSRYINSCLSTCKEQFESAIDSLNNAKQAMARKDMGTLNSELSAVITYAGTCEDGFAEADPMVPSPFAKVDADVKHLGEQLSGACPLA